jgi:hypothetical protein
VLRTTRISGVEAEELAILPGMEELSATSICREKVDRAQKFPWSS